MKQADGATHGEPAPVPAPKNPVVESVEKEIRALAAGDLSDPVTARRLKNAFAALQIVREAFAPDPLAEFDAMSAGSDEIAGYVQTTLGAMPAPGLSLGTGLGLPPFRRQAPNAAETFQSRLMREVLAVVPEFLAQGRARVEADRAHAVSDLAHAIDTAVKRGDAATGDLLRAQLKVVVESSGPVGTGEAAGGAVKNAMGLPFMTREAIGGLIGGLAGSGALHDLTPPTLDDPLEAAT